ncbi:DUF1868 domain-containing protein [Crocosphaera sp. XPORK-15E]|uniref:DUF1868 domain-containing protein n=1 Tax=Crocosphaera sp. XPORK-15E TaxID=3110247 RepID=UPI002B1F7B9C|nr:DUF1868 domain-containing protein [Crocosphaera sp. XPORK-15E]MEA5533130.1 DUF1868 domain-containing protein [Crocosphaera sp. XPORK-15E]
MDETYQIYVNRVASLTLPATYQTQLKNIQKSPKFQEGQPIAFPGYTILTPPYQDDSVNEEFYHQLTLVQQELLAQIEPKILIPVPPESFHLTVADLIWDDSYRLAVQTDGEFDQKIQQRIAESFNNYQKSNPDPIKIEWQIVGLLLFPRALGVGLVPCDELSYNKIFELRRAIYQNEDLIALGIEQQYHFTAHITLGYFAEIPLELERNSLESILLSFNDQWMEKDPQILTIEQVELRKFEDMSNYLPSPSNPSVKV